MELKQEIKRLQNIMGASDKIALADCATVFRYAYGTRDAYPAPAEGVRYSREQVKEAIKVSRTKVKAMASALDDEADDDAPDPEPDRIEPEPEVPEPEAQGEPEDVPDQSVDGLDIPPGAKEALKGQGFYGVTAVREYLDEPGNKLSDLPRIGIATENKIRVLLGYPEVQPE